MTSDRFNCLGPFSDAKPDQCSGLTFKKAGGHELLGAFKTPSLRGISDRVSFMHAGQFAFISDALDHYNAAPVATSGHSELTKLDLQPDEIVALAAFLATLGPNPH